MDWRSAGTFSRDATAVSERLSKGNTEVVVRCCHDVFQIPLAWTQQNMDSKLVVEKKLRLKHFKRMDIP